MKKRILVLCTGNSCRSQMAHGYLTHFGDQGLEVFSAGIESHGVNPRAITVMKEEGIDISHHTSNNINEYKELDFDFVLTVCDHALGEVSLFSCEGKDPALQFSESRESKRNRGRDHGRIPESTKHDT